MKAETKQKITDAFLDARDYLAAHKGVRFFLIGLVVGLATHLL